MEMLTSQSGRISGLVQGFNVGSNCGDAAGQTVGHAHIHLIPRRKGDIPDPRGGVRGAIPEKRVY
jgi:diadenosine tetraphosphate (Ap4A) HIT family hydrolase